MSDKGEQKNRADGWMGLGTYLRIQKSSMLCRERDYKQYNHLKKNHSKWSQDIYLSRMLVCQIKRVFGKLHVASRSSFDQVRVV